MISSVFPFQKIVNDLTVCMKSAGYVIFSEIGRNYSKTEIIGVQKKELGSYTNAKYVTKLVF